MRAVLVLQEKTTRLDGGIVEAVVWKVPLDAKHPESFRYRMAFIPAGHEKPAVLYDNHHPKGHHKHIDGHESSYQFTSIRQLRIDFHKEIEDWEASRGRIS